MHILGEFVMVSYCFIFSEIMIKDHLPHYVIIPIKLCKWGNPLHKTKTLKTVSIITLIIFLYAFKKHISYALIMILPKLVLKF